MDEKLCQRLLASIQTLIAESTVLPQLFKFKGKDVLS